MTKHFGLVLLIVLVLMVASNGSAFAGGPPQPGDVPAAASQACAGHGVGQVPFCPATP